jgi:hypothetical protein
MQILLFCLMLNNPVEKVIDHVDYIEINSFYDDNTSWVFDQLIFRRYNTLEKRDDIIAWRLLKNSRKQYSEEEKAALQELYKNEILKASNRKEWPTDLKVPFVPEWIGIGNDFIVKDQYIEFEDVKDVSRRVYFNFMIHTHTQYDPELLERDILPKEKRVELTVSKKRSK